ncbi:MAG TPA: hypothetical protein VGI81_05800 [Tepidisphaeraceae bacterium]|jgi:hypothetical protein
MFKHCVIAAAAIAAFGAARARAGLDLTTPGASGYMDGGFFEQGDVQPAGTGVFNTFLQIQAQGAKQAIEQGYNTDYRPAQFDEKNDAPHNHSLLLADVPLVNIDGVEYRQFLLDINQPKGGGSSDLLSLDSLQIFQSNDPNLHNYPTFGGEATQIFDLSASGTSITLNASLSHGSGQSDMIANIPASLFGNSDTYVTLYSEFGATVPAHGGFEEWGVGPAITPTVTSVPLPRAATQGLIGLGLAVVLGAARTRRPRCATA